jgi:Ser/Thr protein kinase RdoA (MazF antagonist)
VTRWLTTLDYPTVEPLPVEQPVLADGCLVTFWHYLPQDGAPPTPADLGDLLRRLHRLPPPPTDLPAYEPLWSVAKAIDHSAALTRQERAWLAGHCRSLVEAYRDLNFALQPGTIHGDAYRGNLLRDGSRVVLADWDSVSHGPREIDLIPTLQARRFGLPDDQRAQFTAAYGHDITTWPGYPTLRDIRELSTLTALLRNARTDPPSLHELRHRIHSIRQKDDRTWMTF